MGVTPQELKKIMDAKSPGVPSGGFVASTKFTGSAKLPSQHTARQFAAAFHLGKTFK